MIWWIQLLCLTVVGILLFTSPRAISLLPPFVALPYLDHSFPLLPSTPSLWQSVQFSQYGSFGVSSASPDAFPTFNIAAHPPPITCRGRNSALVKVFSAALNPADSKITLGYLTPLLPAFLKDRTTPGFDFSGEIISLNAPHPVLSPGTLVYGMTHFLDQGTLSDHVCVSVDYIAAKPRNLSHNEAASLPLAAVTAYQSLKLVTTFGSVSKLLVLGGGGAVGSLAVQLGKAVFGIDYIAATVSPRSNERVAKYGVDLGVDYTDSLTPWHDFLLNFEVVRDFQGVIDTVGGDDVYYHIGKLIDPGSIMVTVAGEEPAGVLSVSKVLTTAVYAVVRNGAAVYDYSKYLVGLDCRTCCGLRGGWWHHTTAHGDGQFLTVLAGLVEEGKVTTNVGQVFQFDAAGVGEAIERVLGGGGGKVVVEVARDEREVKVEEEKRAREEEEKRVKEEARVKAEEEEERRKLAFVEAEAVERKRETAEKKAERETEPETESVPDTPKKKRGGEERKRRQRQKKSDAGTGSNEL